MMSLQQLLYHGLPNWKVLLLSIERTFCSPMIVHLKKWIITMLTKSLWTSYIATMNLWLSFHRYPKCCLSSWFCGRYQTGKIIAASELFLLLIWYAKVYWNHKSRFYQWRVHITIIIKTRLGAGFQWGLLHVMAGCHWFAVSSDTIIVASITPSSHDYFKEEILFFKTKTR